MLQGITDKKFRFRVTAIFTMALVLLVANVAYAAWTAYGDGTGTATAGQDADLDIEPVSAGTLYPTVTVDLVVEILNPNPYHVQVDDIDLHTDGITVDAGDCDAGDLTWNGGYEFVAGTFVVGPHDGDETPGSATITLNDALTLENDAHDDCRGATFTVNLELNGESHVGSDANPGDVDPAE